MLRQLPKNLPNANVIVGLETPDDAGVYQINEETALVQTLDFFTPIVDDPYAFGQIAAANSLSDVFAMGAQPVTALNIVAFPATELPPEILAEILRGGAEKIQEAGATLIGGHSIDDTSPKYGLSVTGIVHPKRLVTKAGAQPGDKLILTKPLGIGIITHAIKADKAPQQVIAEATQIMATLNNITDLLQAYEIKGGTDVTGFGLLGHALEMAQGAQVGFKIYSGQVPVLKAAYDLAAQGLVPGGSKKNLKHVEPYTTFAPEISQLQRQILADAITSGGLLLAVKPDRAADLIRTLAGRSPVAALIGEVVADHPGTLEILA